MLFWPVPASMNGRPIRSHQLTLRTVAVISEPEEAPFDSAGLLAVQPGSHPQAQSAAQAGVDRIVAEQNCRFRG